jgi:hypothetical protein
MIYDQMNCLKLIFLPKTILLFWMFSKPYSLLPITNFDDIEGLVVSYQNSVIAQTVSAELIFGAIEAKGNYPFQFIQVSK